MPEIHISNINIEKMRENFQNILKTQYDIITIKSSVFKKLQELKTMYSNLVKQNTRKTFLFCLDSVFFQYKILSIELEDIVRHITLIHNRIYGDYYKLYQLILEQSAILNIDMFDLTNEFTKYTVYDDLELFREYKHSDVIQLHADIIHAVNLLYMHFASKKNNINSYNEQITAGISINSFLHTLDHENLVLQEHIHLYNNYIVFFHTSHMGYLTKALNTINRLLCEIDAEIMTTNRNKSEPSKELPLMNSVSKNNTPRPSLETIFAVSKTAVKTAGSSEIEKKLQEIDKLTMVVKSPSVPSTNKSGKNAITTEIIDPINAPKK